MSGAARSIHHHGEQAAPRSTLAPPAPLGSQKRASPDFHEPRGLSPRASSDRRRAFARLPRVGDLRLRRAALLRGAAPLDDSRLPGGYRPPASRETPGEALDALDLYVVFSP